MYTSNFVVFFFFFADLLLKFAEYLLSKLSILNKFYEANFT